MRIRTIKPEFFLHSDLFDAEKETGLPLRVAYIGLWCACDREGRFQWKPRQLKAQILPHDEVDFSRVLDALTTRGFVCRYASATRERDSKNGDLGVVPSFKRHQVVNNREKPSCLTSPLDTVLSTRAPRVPHACPTPLDPDREEGKGREGNKEEEEARGKTVSSTGSERPLTGYEVPSDAEVIAWTGAWQGEAASGAPRMPEEWVLAWLSRMVGRREWPADWRRKVVLDWRVEFRTWAPRSATGSSGMGPKTKNGAPEIKGIGTVFATERPTGTFKPVMI